MLTHEGINTFLFWTGVFFLSWYAYIIAFNRGVPNIRTAPAIRKKIIELMKRDAAARGVKNYTIVDVGSGNGLFTREMARSLPNARVIGVEVSRQQLFWANRMKAACGLDNLEYKKADIFAYDLSQADAVSMFFYQMHKMGEKLHRELKPGTLVASVKFRLGAGWEPVEELDVKTLYPFQKKLYIYRKT